MKKWYETRCTSHAQASACIINEKGNREKNKESGTNVVTGHTQGKKGIGLFELCIRNFLHMWTLVYTAELSDGALN